MSYIVINNTGDSPRDEAEIETLINKGLQEIPHLRINVERSEIFQTGLGLTSALDVDSPTLKHELIIQRNRLQGWLLYLAVDGPEETILAFLQTLKAAGLKVFREEHLPPQIQIVPQSKNGWGGDGTIPEA